MNYHYRLRCAFSEERGELMFWLELFGMRVSIISADTRVLCRSLGGELCR
jgi:hypothetical protein